MNYVVHPRLVAAIALLMLAPAQAAQHRWYAPERAAAGESVYRQHCVACHLESGAGTAAWQARDADGKLPPPPLNGTAHTWHHDLRVLARTIVEGGAQLGGSMPAFGDKLSAEEVADVIAYVQSLWPDDIYRRWSGAFPEDAANGLPRGQQTAKSPEPQHAAVTRLSGLLPPETRIGEPEETPVDGILGIRAGSRYFHVDSSGRYLFTGDLVDLISGENLSQTRYAAIRRDLMAEFPDADKVTFPASGDELAAIDVFTDTTCPYCRRLHQEVPELQAAGVTVRYLPFPRGGNRGAGYDQLRSVWCAGDRASEMNTAKSGPDYRPANTDCPAANAVTVGYRLGVEAGVTGTPAIVLDDGTLLPGYMPASDLLTRLGIKGG